MGCERCSAEDVIGMWSPDGLPGHEFLVCSACWKELNESELVTSDPSLDVRGIDMGWATGEEEIE